MYKKFNVGWLKIELHLNINDLGVFDVTTKYIYDISFTVEISSRTGKMKDPR